MSRRLSSPTFVGRSEELGALRAALSRAQAGEAAAVLVAGESGVGKSRLVAEFERIAEDAGTQVLAGACVDLGDAELPYAPLVAALRALARDIEVAELQELAGHDRGELARLLPELGDAPAPPGGADANAQVRLYEALLGLLARVARRAPVVFVIEDLQWSDPSTRGFLQFLVRTARREPLMLLATYRSDDLHRRHPLRPFLADIQRAPGVERVELASFTRDELAAQLEAILEETPAGDLVDELFERSGGNAFFSEELLAASRAGAATVPDAVRDVLTARVEQLAEPTQGVLGVAATAGGSVSHQLLAAASGLPEDELAQALRAALEHHVLVHDAATQGYAFRHALLREALYDDLLPNERSALHRTLAQALETDVAGTAAERAFHWSGAHEPAPAFRAAMEASDDAHAVSAFAEASRQLERALELWDAVAEDERPEGTTLVDLLRRAADAAFLAGVPARAASLARRALEATDVDADPLTAGAVGERLGRYLWVLGDTEGALAEYATVAALLPPHPSGERAAVIAGHAHVLMLDGDCMQAAELAREAIDVARTVGAAQIECAALNTLGAAVGILGGRDEAIETLRTALDLALRLDAQEELTRSYVNLSEILDQDGRLDEAAELAIEGWRRLRVSIASQAPFALSEGLARLVRLGRWDDAIALADEAGEIRGFDVFGFAATMAIVDLKTARGDLDAAEVEFARALSDLGRRAPAMWRYMAARVGASLAVAQRRPAEARKPIGDLVAGGVMARSGVMFAVPAYVVGVRAEADLAELGRSLGDDGALGEAVKRGTELVEQVRAVAVPEQWPLGSPPPELLAHADLAELELARAHGSATADAWGANAARWESLGRPPAAAYARWREAEAAISEGLPRPRAAASLTSARSTAARLGARPLLEQIDEFARRARLGGTPVASDDPTERLGLTPREIDVLRLLAEGRTNAEIGAALYMSPKTASVHVSRIITKLSVKTRIEAATAAHRLGLAGEPTS